MSWLSLILFILMLAVMFFQTLHGAYSALIMAVVTVLSACVALSVHETLAEDMLVDMIGDYAYPVALGGVFAVLLLGLRLALDKFITRRPLLPSLVDRGASLACGIVTGLVATGMVGISIQMIPWGPEILGFERYDKNGKARHSLWGNPDQFTVNLCGYLVDKTLSSGERDWLEAHPDFLTELHWFRNTEATGSRISVPRDSVSIVGVGQTSELYDFRPTKGFTGSGDNFSKVDAAAPDKTWLVVSVKAGADAKDEDNYFRTSPTQVRLVGARGDSARIEQYHLKGVNYRGRFVTFAQMPMYGNKSGEFDFVFEVPKMDFQPLFLEFKRSGRVAVSDGLLGKGLQERQPKAASAEDLASADRRPAAPSSGSQRATVPVRPKKLDSHFGTKLPLVIRRYTGTANLSDKALRSGQFTLDVDDQGETPQSSRRRRRRGQAQTTATEAVIEEFSVPGGLQLLQLDVEAVFAETGLAGILNSVRRNLKQYRVEDASGQHYWPAGLIAECDVGDDRIMEVQYYPEDAFDRTQIRDFKRFQWDDLKGDSRLVFLFVVPPGKKIVEFNTGGAPVSLEDLNLVAP